MQQQGREDGQIASRGQGASGDRVLDLSGTPSPPQADQIKLRVCAPSPVRSRDLNNGEDSDCIVRPRMEGPRTSSAICGSAKGRD